MITTLICNNKLNTKYILRSTLIGHKGKQIDLQSVKDIDVAPILNGRLVRTGLEHPNPRTVKIILDSGASASTIQYKYVERS
jgi:hypothetical protein